MRIDVTNMYYKILGSKIHNIRRIFSCLQISSSKCKCSCGCTLENRKRVTHFATQKDAFHFQFGLRFCYKIFRSSFELSACFFHKKYSYLLPFLYCGCVFITVFIYTLKLPGTVHHETHSLKKCVLNFQENDIH